MSEYQHLVEQMKADAKERLASGLKGFPDCQECQCYPEGRKDCPDHQSCREKLGYA